MIQPLLVALLVEPEQAVAFLAQNIEPAPLIQLPQDRDRAKFAVSNEKNSRLFRQQAATLPQKRELLSGTRVAANIFDPAPGDGYGPLAISQGHHQELMTKTNLGAIHDQSDLTDPLKLRAQPFLRDRLVPLAHIHSRVGQEAAQAFDRAHILGGSDHLSGDPAQVDRATMKNTNHQPHKVLNLGLLLPRPQFTNSVNHGLR